MIPATARAKTMGGPNRARKVRPRTRAGTGMIADCETMVSSTGVGAVSASERLECPRCAGSAQDACS